MTRRGQGQPTREDVRQHALFVAWLAVPLAALGWFLVARALGDLRTSCGEGCTAPLLLDPGAAARALALAVGATVGAAVAFGVAAVARVLEADERDS